MPLLTVSAVNAAGATALPVLNVVTVSGALTRPAKLVRLSVYTIDAQAHTFTVTDTDAQGTTRTLCVLYGDSAALGAQVTCGTYDLSPGLAVRGAVTVTTAAAMTNASDVTVTAQFDMGDDDGSDLYHARPFAAVRTLSGSTGLFTGVLPPSGGDDSRFLVRRIVFANTSAATPTGVVVSTRSTETGVIYAGTTAPGVQPLLFVNVPANGNTVVDLGKGVLVPKGMTLTYTPTVSTTSLFAEAHGYQWAPTLSSTLL